MGSNNPASLKGKLMSLEVEKSATIIIGKYQGNLGWNEFP